MQQAIQALKDGAMEQDSQELHLIDHEVRYLLVRWMTQVSVPVVCVSQVGAGLKYFVWISVAEYELCFWEYFQQRPDPCGVNWRLDYKSLLISMPSNHSLQLACTFEGKKLTHQ